jgi:hypothetical protein
MAQQRKKRVSPETAQNKWSFSEPAVAMYCTFRMAEVDRANLYCCNYTFLNNSLKWWRKLYFWILEVTPVNSFHLYNTNHQSANFSILSSLKFQENEWRIGRKRWEQNLLKVTKFNRWSPFQQHTAPNSGTWREGNKGNVKRGNRQMSFYCETCPRMPTSWVPHIIQWRNSVMHVA